MINLADFLKITERWNGSYKKIASPILTNNRAFHFVPHVDGKIYTAESVIPPFKINGLVYSMAKRGFRPGFTKRFSESFPGQDKYLIKFNDGELRVCDQLASTSLLPDVRQGIVIGTAEDNIGYLYMLLQGAGGGGAGSSAFVGAGGGAGGSLIVTCVKTNTIWKLHCGAKGVGGGTSQDGTVGGETFAEMSGIRLVSPGGNGGDYGNQPSYCDLPSYVDNENCHCVLAVRGIKGGAPNGDGDKFAVAIAEKYGHTDELPMTFPEVPAASRGGGLLHGGGGGSSAFGKGGFGSSMSTVGGNAEAYGAGGGGAGQTIAKNGGNGGDGLIEIFY